MDAESCWLTLGRCEGGVRNVESPSKEKSILFIPPPSWPAYSRARFLLSLPVPPPTALSAPETAKRLRNPYLTHGRTSRCLRPRHALRKFQPSTWGVSPGRVP